MNKDNLIWSSDYDEQLCPKIHNCEKCDSDCQYGEYYEKGHYDTLNDMIDEDFHMYFDDNKGYNYFVIDKYYEKIIDGKKIQRYSEIQGSLLDVVKWITKDIGMCTVRIYKDDYNKICIELSHHDGHEYYTLCRLNKMGQEYYDRGYDFDYNKYVIKGVLKDFDFFNR